MSEDNSLKRSTPEEQGIASKAMLNFLEALEKETQLKTGHELHSIMILRHGYVVCEGWWAPYRKSVPHKLFSLSKSFTSTAVGLAVQEGIIGLEDSVMSFFPEAAPEIIGENLAAMNIRHLLTMSAGHSKDTLEALYESGDGNWVRAFLALPVENKPGTHFLYNSGATYMLSAIIQKTTGKTLLEYLQPRFFEPLSIEGATWESCPRGINTGGFGLNLRTEDIARLGQLYLQKGLWDGKRILPEAWVEEATKLQIANGANPENEWEQGYGYQFWRCRHGMYRGDGAFGQFCVVMPEKEVVIATTGATNDMQSILNLIWKHLLPAMEDGHILADRAALRELENRTAGLALPGPSGVKYSPEAGKISGRTYILDPNMDKTGSLLFNFENDFCEIAITGEDGRYTYKCGYGKWIENRGILPQSLNRHNGYLGWKGDWDALDRTNFLLYSSCSWKDSNTLIIIQRFIQTPFYYVTACTFDEEDVYMETAANVSFKEPKHPIVHGRAI